MLLYISDLIHGCQKYENHDGEVVIPAYEGTMNWPRRNPQRIFIHVRPRETRHMSHDLVTQNLKILTALNLFMNETTFLYGFVNSCRLFQLVKLNFSHQSLLVAPVAQLDRAAVS